MAAVSLGNHKNSGLLFGPEMRNMIGARRSARSKKRREDVE